tara:strand:+ start:5198 stop:5443 length:246 start_codon:yes stop_codon:yes gene_type:complete
MSKQTKTISATQAIADRAKLVGLTELSSDLCKHIKWLREQSSESLYSGAGVCDSWWLSDIDELFSKGNKLQEKLESNEITN